MSDVNDLLDRSIPLTRAVYDAMRAHFPDAVITADRDGIGLGTTPGYKGLVFSILPAKAHVTLGFAHGTELPDPAGLLDGKGKLHRHVRIHAESDLTDPALTTLIAEAIARFVR